MSKITSGVLYNARATWDVRQLVTWAREKWPRRKLFGCGFSLGANILVNVCRDFFWLVEIWKILSTSQRGLLRVFG